MEHISINGTESKECTKCHQILPLSEFRKDARKRDGLYPSCKACCSKKDKAIYQRDPKKKYEVVKAYKIRKGIFSESKPYNPAHYSSDESKKKKHIRDAKRRKLEKEANKETPITQEMIDTLIQRSQGKCEYCGKDCTDNYHIDHKLPLYRGGKNNIENLAFCCPKCNWSKGKKTAEEYIDKLLHKNGDIYRPNQ